MTLFHSLRTVWRSEWQIPQKRMSMWTSRSVASRRGIMVEAKDDVGLAVAYALAFQVLAMVIAPSQQCSSGSRAYYRTAVPRCPACGGPLGNNFPGTIQPHRPIRFFPQGQMRYMPSCFVSMSARFSLDAEADTVK